MARRIPWPGALVWRTAVCLSVLLGAVACDAPKPKPLRLGLSDWPGHAPFYGAAKLGHFGSTQVEIKGFSSNFDRNRAFTQGRLDVLATPLFDALLDLTGVPFVDTQVAAALLRAATAARLLGAGVTIVGISPHVAQSIIHLGIDFSGIMTYANLKSGLLHALRNMGFSIQKV